jgi:hypothetical protein
MPKFSAYLTRWRDYTSVDFNRKSTPSENRISSSSYKTRIGNSTVNVSYYGRILNQEKMIVDKCIINGTWNEVANIFIQYWQTKMQFSELKSQTDIIKYTISDKVSFSTLPNGNAKIVVLKSK